MNQRGSTEGTRNPSPDRSLEKAAISARSTSIYLHLSRIIKTYMEGSEFIHLGRLYTNRPPHELIKALCSDGEAWTVHSEELKRAEWMWSKRPRNPLYIFVERHRFLTFSAFALGTLCLVPFVHVLLWLAILTLYPAFVLRNSGRISCWEECYRRALLRVVRR